MNTHPPMVGASSCAEDLSAPSDISARNSYVHFLSTYDLLYSIIKYDYQLIIHRGTLA